MAITALRPVTVGVAALRDEVRSIGVTARTLAVPLRYAGQVLASEQTLRPAMVQKHYDAAVTFRDQLRRLDMIQMLLQYGLQGQQGARELVQQVEVVRQAIVQRHARSQETITQAAVKHMPPGFAADAQTVIRELSSQLTGRFTGAKTDTWVTATQSGAVFVIYHEFQQVRDEQGNVHPSLSLALTCVVLGERQGWYVSLLNQWLPPHYFVKHPGLQWADVDSGIRASLTLLSEYLPSQLPQLALPAEARRLVGAENMVPGLRRWVRDVAVVGHEIQFKLVLSVAKDQVPTIAKALTDYVGRVLGAALPNTTVRTRLARSGRQYQVLVSFIGATGQAHVLTVQQLEALRAVGFDETDVSVLRTMLNRSP